LVYMSGRLLVVDHLVPEAFNIDLVELDIEDAAERAALYPPCARKERTRPSPTDVGLRD
jgi:hypothetical protein